MRNPIAILLLLSSLLLISCDSRTAYMQYHAVPVTGWHQDSVLCYDVTITDTLATYSAIINVRHTEIYPYQNMWLFVGNDTIEFYLADDRGQWLGNSRSTTFDMPVLYEEQLTFTHPGTYHYEIRHAMRDSLLRGVSDVGLTIRKNGKE